MTHQDNSRGKRSARGRRVIELYEAGAPCTQIAEELGVRTSRVSYWCGRYADKTKRESAKKRRIADAIERYEQGESAKHIAAEVGVSIPTVHLWARTYSANKTKRKKTKAEQRKARDKRAKQRKAEHQTKRVQRFIELYESGAHVHDIAHEIGIGKTSVHHWVTRYQPNKEARYKHKRIIRKSTVTYENDARVRRAVELYENGAHRLQIAEEVGVSVSQIYRWCGRYVDKTKREQAKAEQRKER